MPSDGGLADLDAGLEQFAMNARRAPERVSGAHLVDQVVDFSIRLGSSGTA